jgi:two-component system, NarL family, invasion response regulator UvrY
MKKRIIIIDDEPLIPHLIKELIEEDHEFEISQIAVSKEEFLTKITQGTFDIALIDISIGEREGGIELLKILKSKGINLPAIILSAHDEIHYALKCLTAGAKGYINKSCICVDLARGITEVLAGHLFVSGRDGEFILKEYKRVTDPASPSQEHI